MALAAPKGSVGYADARNTRVVTWTGRELVHIPPNRLFGLIDVLNLGSLSIGGSYNLAPLHVGNRNTENSSDSQILVSRTVDNTITGNGHAFSDSSLITRSAGGPIGYNSFDGRVDFGGTANFDHYAAFQSGPTYSSSGTMTNYYGYFSILTVTAGTVSNSYGAYVANGTGAGAVTNQYGYYVDGLTKGSSNNYAFYSAGTTPSYFGGNVTCNADLSVGDDLTVTGGASAAALTISGTSTLNSIDASGAATIDGGLTVGASGTALSTIIHGTYTPTLTANANIASSTPALFHYERTGNRVHCWGAISVTPTLAANTQSSIYITLPIASAFAASTDARGLASAGSQIQRAGDVRADAASDRAILLFRSENTTNIDFTVVFDYEII